MLAAEPGILEVSGECLADILLYMDIFVYLYDDAYVVELLVYIVVCIDALVK